MRISDWSSDVCSSDLDEIDLHRAAGDLGPIFDRKPRKDAVGALQFGESRVIHALCPLFRTIKPAGSARSEEHTSELQSLMRSSYAVFCLTKKKQRTDMQ